MWLTACEHGDEVLSTASVVEFASQLDSKTVRGKPKRLSTPTI
jgi:predicted deacylase